MVEDDALEELSMIGTVWAGFLKLDSAIPATEVAAMLSASELVKATRFVESEQHWSSAASFAAVGSFCENVDTSESAQTEAEDEPLPIGFLPGHTSSPKS